MKAKFTILFFLFFGAELVASWWIWGRAPTDSIRVWYSGFWAFEAGRLYCWIIVFAALLVIWLLGWYRLLRHRGWMISWLFCVVLGVGLETATSIFYWRSTWASGIRSLFQSVWYWHRVPLASDLGWPSMRIYIWHHLVPWAAIVLVGITLWIFVVRKVRVFRQLTPAKE
jgi:hypothetical protein